MCVLLVTHFRETVHARLNFGASNRTDRSRARFSGNSLTHTRPMTVAQNSSQAAIKLASSLFQIVKPNWNCYARTPFCAADRGLNNCNYTSKLHRETAGARYSHFATSRGKYKFTSHNFTQIVAHQQARSAAARRRNEGEEIPIAGSLDTDLSIRSSQSTNAIVVRSHSGSGHNSEHNKRQLSPT